MASSPTKDHGKSLLNLQDMMQIRNSLPFIVITVGVIIGATLLVYGQELQVTFSDALVFTSGNVSNYVIALPFMSLFILYRKRKVLLATISRKDGSEWYSLPLGISIVLAAVVIFLYGSATLYAPYYHIYSMVIFISGSTILLFNFSTFRHAFFAIAILAFLQPPPGELVAGYAADISWVSGVILDNSLKVMGIPATLNANLGAPAFILTKPGGEQNTFVIGEPSSGVFSTIGMSVFAIFVAYISGGKIWKRVALFAISFPLFFLLNTTRIGMIMLMWYFFNNDAAKS